MEDAEVPMAAAEATGEIASGNESKGIQGREVCEEDHHSGLDLFWDTVALPDWEDVFYCGVRFGFFFLIFGGTNVKRVYQS